MHKPVDPAVVLDTRREVLACYVKSDARAKDGSIDGDGSSSNSYWIGLDCSEGNETEGYNCKHLNGLHQGELKTSGHIESLLVRRAFSIGALPYRWRACYAAGRYAVNNFGSETTAECSRAKEKGRPVWSHPLARPPSLEEPTYLGLINACRLG